MNDILYIKNTYYDIKESKLVKNERLSIYRVERVNQLLRIKRRKLVYYKILEGFHRDYNSQEFWPDVWTKDDDVKPRISISKIPNDKYLLYCPFFSLMEIKGWKKLNKLTIERNIREDRGSTHSYELITQAEYASYLI